MEVDEFSDDGFDDLPDNALQELERNAFQLTQAQAKQQSSHDAPPRLSDYGWEEEDDDLDNTEVTNHVGMPVRRPAIDNTLQQRQQPQLRQHNQPAGLTASQAPHRIIPPLPNPRWNPAISTFNRATTDDNGRPHSRLPPNIGPASNVSFMGSQRFQPQTTAQASQFHRPPPPMNRFSPSPSTQAGQPDDMLSALRQRVRVLESELHSAKGEASILRAKANKSQQDFDGKLARMKKLNAEQLDKQSRVMEAAVAAEKTANTELQFLQRDMREVYDRARRKEAGIGGGAGASDLVITPRKAAKSWGFADGFDEMDIAVSPSKGQGRGRASGSVAANVGERTPSKGKRKRPAIESPLAALDISMDDAANLDEGEKTKEEDRETTRTVLVATPPPSFEFLQLVLDHGAFHQRPPTFDILSRFSFPSDPNGTSFSSMIFEKLPLMGNPYQPMQLLVDFCEHIISLWVRCVEEQFWEPVKYLVALIVFTLDLHTTSVAPWIVPNLVPVAQSTVFALAESQRRVADGSQGNTAECAFLEQHIDTTQLLFLLYTSALSCSATPTEMDNGRVEYTTKSFWSLMSTDVVLMLLAPRQKASDVMSMLELLATSVLPASIGPVSADVEPSNIARVVIERVSAKLTEQPRISMTPKQRRSVRLAALRTMIAFAASSFGAMQLALHDNAIPRLVTCLSAAIDELYDQDMPTSLFSATLLSAAPPSALALCYPKDSTVSTSSSSSAAAELYLVISQSVLLVHRLVTDAKTANVVEIGQKLALAHGGSQRYLLALGRLAFAEDDLVMEAGIESDVVEAAAELLELKVTPDEGEIVSEAFGA